MTCIKHCNVTAGKPTLNILEMWQSLTDMYQAFFSEFVFHCLIVLHVTLIPSEVLLVHAGGYYEMGFYYFVSQSIANCPTFIIVF